MTDDPTTPAQIRGVFSATLTDEPGLLDMVPDAVAGARARRRRERVTYVAAPLAIVGLAAGAYAAVPAPSRGEQSSAASPTATRTPGAHTTPAAVNTPEAKSAVAPIPALADPFAHPGTPEENCQGNFSGPPTGQAHPTVAEQKAQCVANLTALRALLPGDTVVLEHSFQPGGPQLDQLMTGMHDINVRPPGTKLPELAATVVSILNDPKDPSNHVDPNNFLVKTPTGVMKLWFADGPGDGSGTKSGTGQCENGKSGGTTSKPCSAVTLADGTAGDFVAYPNGVIEIVIPNDPYGNEFFFLLGHSERDVLGTTYTDGGGGQWLDLATGVVHQGNRDVPNPYTKDQMLALTGSQGFLAFYQQVAKALSGH
ncbi:hypothetical protein [Catenulispora subtropica]